MNPQLLMAQSALRGNIDEGMAVAKEAEGNLYSAASLPPLGSDSVSYTLYQYFYFYSKNIFTKK